MSCIYQGKCEREDEVNCCYCQARVDPEEENPCLKCGGMEEEGDCERCEVNDR